MIYTSAIIKEVLRIHPPASTVWFVKPVSTVMVRAKDGTEYYVNGTLVYSCLIIIDSEDSFDEDTANDLLPERWFRD
jgi:cytochrome P450